MTEVFLKILNMSISASWLVLVVLVLRVLLKKAPKWISVLLWGIVGIRLICPFSIESELSLIPSGETISDNILTEQSFRVQTGIVPVDNRVNDYIVNRYYEGVTVPVNTGHDVMSVLSVLWAVGILGLVIYTGVSYWRLHRQLETAVLLRDGIYQSENVSSPFVFGVIRPKIYISFQMEGQELGYVLAHEQAHIKRRDHWWKPLGFALLVLHWFNPLMWLAYALLCRDIEQACDERVIEKLEDGQRADYSQTLLSCSANRKRIAACPLAFGEAGVKERVKSVLNYRKPAFWIVAVAVAACGIVAVCFLTNPEMEEESKQSVAEVVNPNEEESAQPSDEIANQGEESVQPSDEVINQGEESIQPSVEQDEVVEASESSEEEQEQVIPTLLMEFGGADLDHDGTNEKFRIDEVIQGQVYQLDVVKEDGSIIWSEEAATPHVGWNSVFLCELDGEAYLLRYNPTMYQGEAAYYYELFWVENGEPKTVESNSLTFSTNPNWLPDAEKREEMMAFEERINELLSNSVVLLSTEDGGLEYGGGSAETYKEKLNTQQILEELRKVMAASGSEGGY